MTASKTFETKEVSDAYDYLAPDTSEIRLLTELWGGGLAHCTLPPGQASGPVYHKTVEELWFFISGEGEVWRKDQEQEMTVPVRAGVSLSIPLGTAFQFRNTGKESLCFIIATFPPWPGAGEAVPTTGIWLPSENNPTSE